MDSWCEPLRVQQDDAAYQVTPWADPSELIDVRAQLFGLGSPLTDADRQTALHQIYAWQARGLIPLPVESTALLVEAQLLDRVGTRSSMALRMIYAIAIIRFVTAICDSFQPGGGDKLPMQTIGSMLQLPSGLVETRHNATHKVFPSLKVLQAAAEESLRWLWNFYWKDIDQVIRECYPEDTEEAFTQCKNDIQAILRSHLSTRRTEVKKKISRSTATYEAGQKCLELCRQSTRGINILAILLVDEQMILPSGREFGSSMQGAFLLWDDLLIELTIGEPDFLDAFTAHIVTIFNSRTEYRVQLDPFREGLSLWIEHILLSEQWGNVRTSDNDFFELKEKILSGCFLNFSYWNRRIIESILKNDTGKLAAIWTPLLDACLDTSSSATDLMTEKGPLADFNNYDMDSTLPKGWSRWSGD